MFDSYYHFSLIQKTPKTSGCLLAEYIFQFRTETKRYIVIAEEYQFNVFAVKFFPADKKNHQHRYNLVVNDFKFPSIIRTCVNIMLWLLEQNPAASFAYVGVNTITDGYTENKTLTQRYRVYEYVMDVFLNPYRFKRYVSKRNSAVLLVNAVNENIEELAQRIINMFVELYDELDNDLL